MLSKLFYFQDSNNHVKKPNDDFWQIVQQQLQRQGIECEVLQKNIGGGTLGILSLWNINGKKFIAKTHLSGIDGRLNIAKENYILTKLYGSDLATYFFNIQIGEEKFNVLFIEFLEQLRKKPDFIKIQQLIHLYQDKINNTDEELNSMCLYRNKNLIEQYDVAVRSLEEQKLITPVLTKYFMDSKEDFANTLKYDNAIAHGDLSNKNLMTKNDNIIIIDWEDAFFTNKVYDMLYWLTFMDQKDYLKKVFLEKNNLMNTQTRNVLSSIVMFKSYISLLNGSYKKNRISINDRILSIVNLFD